MSSPTAITSSLVFQCAICGLPISEDSAVAISWHATDHSEETQSARAHKACLAAVLHSSVPHGLSTHETKGENNKSLGSQNVDATNQPITLQDGFWITWYYLKRIYDNTGGTLDLSDILSASEPFFQPDQPADSAMTEYWLEAYEKFLKEGIPPLKTLK